jgi:glycosyltransferase involved in cell wall biosynthesis
MISAIIPVYNNESTLIKNINRLCEVEKVTEIVCVFDGYACSNSVRKYIEARKGKVVNNYPNIPWGNSRARNLGAINAKNDYLLFIDVDHTIKDQIHFNAFTKGHVYKFKRVLNRTEWHCNTLLMHRDMYFDVGGYDERFCGHYGYEDRHIEFKLRREGYEFTNLQDEVIVLEGGGVDIERDKSRNQSLFKKLTCSIDTIK